MPQAGTVVVDGKPVTIYYQTGTVTATRKQKETQIRSNVQYHGNQAVTSTSSSTVDHHELFITDASGREHAFNIIDMDFPVREGNTVSVVWIIPEGKESGPFVQVLNHSTGTSTYCPEGHLTPLFAKKAMMWGATIGGTILGFLIFWPLGFAGMIGPFIYFNRRVKKAVKGMFASREYQALQAQLTQVKPAAAAAVAAA
jgi:hypothetical protein